MAIWKCVALCDPPQAENLASEILFMYMSILEEIGMNYNITFPEQIISNVNTAGLIMISVIFVLGFVIFMRYSAQIMPAIIGLLAYLLLVVAGVEVVTMLLTMIPGLGGLLVGTALAFCLTRTVIMAMLVHFTRAIIINFTNRNQNITLGDAMIGGLGMGTCQAIVSGVDFLTLSSLGTMVNSEGLATLVQGMSAEEVAEIVASLEQTIEIPPMFFLLKGLNNSLDIVFHVMAAIIVYAIVKKGLPAIWYGITILFNIFAQAASMFGDYQVVSNYAVLSFFKLVVVGSMIVCVLRIDTNYLGNEVKSFDKMRKSKGAMPKFGKLKNK